jgi:hypothetical protein
MSIVDGIHEYVEYAESYVYATVSAAAAEMPMINDALHKLWTDVSRFGPSMPDIRIPGLGDFEVPPPPPPPPPPRSFCDKSVDWVGDHPWTVTGIGAGVIGVGLYIGYSGIFAHNTPGSRRTRPPGTGERRQVIGMSE